MVAAVSGLPGQIIGLEAPPKADLISVLGLLSSLAVTNIEHQVG